MGHGSRKMENKTKVNRKGIVDLFQLMIILFSVSMTLILVTTLYGAWTDKFYDTTLSEYSYANASTTQILEVTQSFDWILIAVLIGVFIGVSILAMYIPSNPGYIVFYILLAMIGVVIAGGMSNMYEEFADAPELSGTVSSYYPMTDLIMSNLPYIFLAFVGLLLIITYVRWLNAPTP